MRIGVPKELHSGEARVALVPGTVAALAKAKLDVLIQAGAGAAAGFSDAAYESAGAQDGTRQQVFESEIILSVRALGADPANWMSDLAMMKQGQIAIATA